MQLSMRETIQIGQQASAQGWVHQEKDGKGLRVVPTQDEAC